MPACSPLPSRTAVGRLRRPACAGNAADDVGKLARRHALVRSLAAFVRGGPPDSASSNWPYSRARRQETVSRLETAKFTRGPPPLTEIMTAIEACAAEAGAISVAPAARKSDDHRLYRRYAAFAGFSSSRPGVSPPVIQVTPLRGGCREAARHVCSYMGACRGAAKRKARTDLKPSRLRSIAHAVAAALAASHSLAPRSTMPNTCAKAKLSAHRIHQRPGRASPHGIAVGRVSAIAPR